MSPDDFPTYQVYIIQSGDGERFDVGDPVTTLEEATEIVDDLDDRFMAWEAQNFPGLPANDILNHYEGCDVGCRRGSRNWEFNDGQWEEIA